MSTLDQQHLTNTGNIAFAYGTRYYMAMQITVGASGLIAQADAYIYKYGATHSGNVNCAIYSDSGSNLPNAAISDVATYAVASFPTSLDWVVWTFSVKPNISSGTKVWIVIHYPGGTAGNGLRWGTDTGMGYSALDIYYSTDGSSWTAGGSPENANFKEYYDSVGWAGGTLSGVASASISTVDTVAIANISSINTV
jgi:hypothetical protein